MKKKKKSTDFASKNLFRLNKLIADAGIASRRKADELIKRGLVKVNGEIISEPGHKARLSDKIEVEGKIIKSKKKLVYYVLNKPKNVISTASDELGRKTVVELVKTKERIYPVGRLDRNTTGVLLLTNDGELAARLIHPKYQIERIYSVTLDKELRLSDAKKIAKGTDLDGEKTAPCSIFIEPKNPRKASIILTEGKNREVRRLFEKFGYEVKQLDRKLFAGVSAEGLKRGESRKLTKKEIAELKKLVGI